MAHREQRKQHLLEFHRRAKLLLTDLERDFLHDALKEYQQSKDVRRLMTSLRNCLDTPVKLDLLKDIRNLIPTSHSILYDQLAPYSRMASNRIQPNPSKMRKMPSVDQRPGSRPNSRPSSLSKGGGNSYLNDAKSLHVITINKDSDSLGFSIRGGSEHSLGIFVGYVQKDSVADQDGLQVGDQILEVNKVSFENVASSSAAMVLEGSQRLKMLVKRTGHIPGAIASKQKTAWYNTISQAIVDLDSDDEEEEKSAGRTMEGTRMLTSADERRITLHVRDSKQCLGFNIRGGAEFGLGIFVSGIDQNGLAESCGLYVGDQIIDVNGQNFEGLTHAKAVECMRGQKHLIMTVRNVNRYPAFREKIAEYSWLNGMPGQKIERPQTVSPTLTPIKPSVPSYNKSEPSINHSWPRQLPPGLGGIPGVTGHPANSMPSSAYSALRADHTGGMDSSASSSGLDSTSLDFDHTDMAFDSQLLPPPATEQLLQARLEESFNQVNGDVSFTSSLPFPPPPHPPSIERRTIDTQTDSKTEKSSKSEKKSKKSGGGTFFGFKIDKRKKVERSQSLNFKQEKGMLASEEDAIAIEPKRGGTKLKRSRSIKELLFGSKSKSKTDKDSINGDDSTINDNSEKKKKRSLGISFGSLKKNRPVIVKRRPESNNDGDSTASETSYGSIGRHKGVFVTGAGSQLMLEQASTPSPLAMIESMARQLLNEDEVNAVIRHIKRYQKEGDIELMIYSVLAILDRPEKMILLGEIRNIITPTDIGRFDSMVTHKQSEAYQSIQSKPANISSKPLKEVKHEYGGPRKTLLTTQPDSMGNFMLRQSQEDVSIHLKKEEPLKAIELNKVMLPPPNSHVPTIGRPATKNGNGISTGQAVSKNSNSITTGQPVNKNGNGILPTVRTSTPNPPSKEKPTVVANNGGNLPNHHDNKEVILISHKTEEMQLDRSPLRPTLTRIQVDHDSADGSEMVELNTIPVEDLTRSPPVPAVTVSSSYMPADPLDIGSDDSTSVSSASSSDREVPNQSGFYQLIDQFLEKEEDPNKSPAAPPADHHSNDDIDVDALYARVDFSKKKSRLKWPPSPPSGDQSQVKNGRTSPLFAIGDEGKGKNSLVSSLAAVWDENKGKNSKSRSLANVEGEEKGKNSQVSSLAAVWGESKGKNSQNFLMVGDEGRGKNGHISPLATGAGGRRESKGVMFAENGDNIPSANSSAPSTPPTLPKEPKSILKNSHSSSGIKKLTEVEQIENQSVTPMKINKSYSEDEPSPLRDIMVASRRVRGHGPQTGQYFFHKEDPVVEIQVELKKNKSTLGISISGGKDSKSQPTVKIEKIFPGGSAAENPLIKAGSELVSVDGNLLINATHSEAVDVIRKAYNNKSKAAMSLVLIHPTS